NVSWISEQLIAQRQALANVNFTRERQRIDHGGCDPSAWKTLEEVIGGSGGENAVKFAQGQRRNQTKGIKMTRMICYQDERFLRRQVLPAGDRKTMIRPQPGPNYQCGQGAQPVHKNIRLAR